MIDHESATSGFGPLLQRHRTARRISQLDLANQCEISSRHLSFLESGRAQPSREMVLRLSAGLILPLSTQNTLLLSAGFAPAFPASPLQSEALEPFRAVLDEMMARHDPNPALLVDRHWNVRRANAVAGVLLAALQEREGEINLPRMMAQSARAEAAIANYPEVLNEIAARIRLEALEAGDDAVLAELVAMLDAACARHPLKEARKRQPVLPLELRVGDATWRFLSIIAHFGTSEDATIRDLRLELLFPADGATRDAVKALAAQVPVTGAG